MRRFPSFFVIPEHTLIRLTPHDAFVLPRWLPGASPSINTIFFAIAEGAIYRRRIGPSVAKQGNDG